MTTAGLILASIGALFILLAAIGLLRFPDVYTRSHAASKAATLGICSVLLGAAVGLEAAGAVVRAALAMIFLLTGLPVAAQLVARAAFRAGVLPAPDTRMDPALCDVEEEESGGEENGQG